jgi:superfamily II DNA or RNA helicase
MVWIPRGAISNDSPAATEVVRDLKVLSTYAEDTDKPIKLWEKSDTHTGLPLHYGLRFLKQNSIAYVDERSNGYAIKTNKRPSPRNAKQEKFFVSLAHRAKTQPTVLAVAPTGSGKTVSALNAIAELGRTALVIVPSKNLAHQWRDEAMLHLGLDEKDVSIMESGKCLFVRKKIVVAVIHNLLDRDWGSKFYHYFGTVIWDEAHRLGARMFSQTVKQFPAKHRIALTATPLRRDGCTPILTHSFGLPDSEVKGTSLAIMPCKVYVVNWRQKLKVGRVFGGQHAQLVALINAVASDMDRNRALSEIAARAYRNGRHILLLSDRINQLAIVRELLTYKGVPLDDMGLFVGSWQNARVSQRKLNDIKENCRIILATYGMMKEGQNVPRLDFGMDLTPRAEGVQALGRIRRVLDGKKHPVWVTCFDHSSDLLSNISGARIRDYRTCGAQVINEEDAKIEL